MERRGRRSGHSVEDRFIANRVENSFGIGNGIRIVKGSGVCYVVSTRKWVGVFLLAINSTLSLKALPIDNSFN